MTGKETEAGASLHMGPKIHQQAAAGLNFKGNFLVPKSKFSPSHYAALSNTKDVIYTSKGEILQFLNAKHYYYKANIREWLICL